MNMFSILAARINATNNGIPVNGANKVVGDVLDIVYFVAGIICVIVIIIAGIIYSTSNGDSSRVTQAKNAILYAIVGLVVILMAFAITGFIIERF